MRHVRTPLLVGLAVASIAAAQPAPSELSALVAKARLDQPVAAWCQAEFRAGHPGAFAVALTDATGGGRYLVLESDATTRALASFVRAPDLACYSRAEADALGIAIGESPTIQGRITPRWETAVICAFVDDTTSVCWQYSPVDGTFVKVGGWVT